MRKLTALFAAIILALNLAGCTSSDSKEDGTEDGAIAEESTEGTDADLANLDAPPAEDSAVASSDGANEGFLDEQLPEDALGESAKVAEAETAPPSDVVDNTTPPPAMEEPKAEEPLVTEAAPIEAPTEAPADTSVAAIDSGTTTSSTEPTESVSDSSSSGVAAMTSSSEPAPLTESKPKASLKKVEAAPFSREGILLNAVYVARSGDNYKKISKLIYGSDDKVKELKKVNPSVKPRVGDKIYYNSPVRPADDTKLLTYYEDAGLVPDVYVAQEGDDLKKVSKNLLGHKDAWKEVWATNMIDSKDVLAAGTELRYWKSAPAPVETAQAPVTEAPKQEFAMSTPPPDMAAPPPMPEQPPQDLAAQPPPAMPEMPPPQPTPPQAEMAPPPPPPMEMQPPPPMDPVAEAPPPPPAEMAPPPPPPIAKKAPQVGEVGGMDNDMMMSLAGAGIIAAGLAAVIIIRKRRQNRDMAQAFNDTQVGT